MNKFKSLFALLFIIALCSNSVKAQYTMLTDFTGGIAFTTGSSPQWDQNLISDGTYLYGMTYQGGANNLGTAFKIKITDNTYTKILDFAGTANGSNPQGSLISDGIYLYGMTPSGGANGWGTAFKIKISDNTYTKILDFTTTNGGYPFGSLISDGTYLYGMTYAGGANGRGTAFKIKITDNTFTKILDFAGTSNGSIPYGSLISDGIYLYGMTQQGGSNNMGTAFKIKISDNTYTKLIDFAGAANGSTPFGSLISDGTYLYGMTSQGGANGLGTAFKIKITDNTYTKILDFNGTNGYYPYGSLISDGTYLYGMTSQGVTNGGGTAFKIKITDNAYTKILDFAGTANGSYPYGSLISDGTYLYGMTQAGGAYNFGTAFKIKITDNTYTKLIDFAGAVNGSNPGSLISDGTYLYGMTQAGGAYNFGTAFKIKITDNTFTRILDFAGTANGSYPWGSLISDGTYLYGMTSGGGVYNAGTAFKIKISDNTYTKILDFAGTANGSIPFGSLISDGTYLYGMTRYGGVNGLGTAFKIKITDNTYTKILDFAGTANGSYPYGSLVSDGTYLYGMTPSEGANNLGTAFKIKITDNTYTKILDFAGTANGSNPQGSLISDGTYLYGLTIQGGTNSAGTAFKIKISDNTYTKILDFTGANGGYPYGSLIFDGTYLYGMTGYGGANNLGTAFKIKITDNTYTKLIDFAGAANGSNPQNTQLVINGSFLYGTTANGGSAGVGTVFKYQIYYPVITSFSPTTGPIGTLVTISGTSLTNPSAFTIGGKAAIVISNTGTTLVGMVMPGATTGNISITTGGGTVNSASNFMVTPSLLPVTQQGSKLVGTGYSGGAPYQGSSISLSSDGNTALVGGSYDNNNIGAAWIYTRSGSTWTQQGSKLVGTGYSGTSGQGTSVSLSADGNTALVGGQGDNGYTGAAWIYTRSGSTWTQQGSKLVGTGYIGIYIYQGFSVSLSADGNTALVGGQGDNNYIGAAWVYTRSGSTWTQQGIKLVGTGNVGQSFQGSSVSLSADGNTALVGGYGDNNYIGAAWIYTRSGSTWTQQGAKLVGTSNVGQSYQGRSVSLSADGNTALVGGLNDNSGIGAAWIYTRTSSTWTQQGAKLVGTGYVGTSEQGISVSLSADGNTALVGGYGDNTNIGAAWIYTRTGSGWTQQGSKLVGTGYTGNPQQGYSVSLSSDGNTALVGGLNDNTGIGAAWVFTPPPPPTVASFTPASGSVGSLVTISGTSLTNPTAFTIGGKAAIVISNDGSTLVGMVMPGATTGNISLTTGGGTVNSASNFTVIPSLLPNVQQGSKLVGTGNIGTSQQGYSVSLSADGNTAIVGGYNDNGLIGAAWIYTRSGSTWTQQGSKLIGTGYIGASQQGFSVSLSADGNTALVGGYYDNSGIGAAWIYTHSGIAWTQQGNKLVGSGYIGASQQGISVSLSADGNTALVGGFNDNNYIGASWIYTRSGSTWTQQGSKLVGTGNSGGSLQGSSVSLSADGNTALVGGRGDNSSIGAAWIYTRTGSAWTQQGAKLVGTSNVGQSYQGYSVSLSADGNTALVGGSYDNNVGAAWIYTRSGSTWTQQGSKLVGTGYTGNPLQGQSVSLSADGNTAIVGGWGDNGFIGAAWIYTRNGSTWTQQGSKLIGTGYVGNPSQGLSVSLSADGNTALVGGYFDNTGIGAAWVFTPLLPPLAIDATGILSNGFTANWNASTGATGYQLDVDDNNDFSSPIINNLDVNGFTTKAVTGLTPLTTYYYRVRAYNANSTSGNSNVITVITVSVITDISDLQKGNVVIVYPNPANGIITLSGLSFIANDQSVSLIISDIFGKTMLSKKLERNTISETIDISSLGNGVYFIILQTDKEKIVKRFVKQ